MGTSMKYIDLEQKNFLREVIGKYMVELGKKDARVTIVNADLMGTCRNRIFNEVFPDRSLSVFMASFLSVGLPKILLSITTMVSAPITVESSFLKFFATLSALFNARFSTKL